MPPQQLTLIPVTPAAATLHLMVHGATYRLLGLLDGLLSFRRSLPLTQADEVDRVAKAAARGEAASMRQRPHDLSSTGSVLTIHAQTEATPPEQVSWTLGLEAAVKSKAWIRQ